MTLPARNLEPGSIAVAVTAKVLTFATARTSEDLGVDAGATTARVLFVFDDDDTSAFSENESGTVSLEWSRGCVRWPVPIGEHAHVVEALHDERRQRRVAPAGDGRDGRA